MFTLDYQLFGNVNKDNLKANFLRNDIYLINDIWYISAISEIKLEIRFIPLFIYSNTFGIFCSLHNT